MDGKPWSPLASAAATFAFVTVIGIVVAIALIHGDLRLHAFERGQCHRPGRRRVRGDRGDGRLCRAEEAEWSRT